MLASKTAIVTGAERGIGKAIAARLVQDEFVVVIADADEPAAIAAAAEVDHAGRALAVFADVADLFSVQLMATAVLERCGAIDLLVNNAGIAGLAAPVADYPEAEWRRILSIDLEGFSTARRRYFHRR